MSKLNWRRNKHLGKLREQAREAKPEKVKGAQTHIKREPCKTYTDAEIAEWAKVLRL